MYMWLVVAVVAAVGVLFLAGMLSPGDRSEDADEDGSAWTSLWRDFRSGTASLRTRLSRLRPGAHTGGDAGSGPDDGPQRVSVLADLRPTGRTAGRRPGRQAHGHRDASAATLAKGQPKQRPADSGRGDSFPRDSHTAESNTSFDDFFEATATSEPAYLDAAQLSDALHHLRR